MTLTEFLEKYNSQSNVGNTPQNKGECTGLVQVWLQEQGLEHVWGNGKDLLVNASPDAYEVIKNTPDAIPEPGDCIVWTAGFNNTYGHTAIVVKGNIKTFEVFEQNNPLGSPCRLHTYPNYAYVDGWFRKRVIIAKPIAMNDQTMIPASLTGWQSDLEIQQIRGMLKEFLIVKVDLQNTRKALEDADRIYGNKIKEYDILTEKLQKQIEDLGNAQSKPCDPLKTPDSYTLHQILGLLWNKYLG
uniref:Peptidase C51 domain-containing protein n=1 Tax=viral metagenome TaxID=1070528 RepID=A0A6M3KSV2_9ZZZZ